MKYNMQKAQILHPEFSNPRKPFTDHLLALSGAMCELLLRNDCPFLKTEWKTSSFWVLQLDVKEGVFHG